MKQYNLYFKTIKSNVRASITISLKSALITIQEKNGIEWISLFGDKFKLETKQKLIEQIIKMYKEYLEGKIVENDFSEMFNVVDSEGKKSKAVLDIPDDILDENEINLDDYNFEFQKVTPKIEEPEYLNPYTEDKE